MTPADAQDAIATHFVPAGTVTLDTQFLRPGSGSAILCRAEIVRAGRSMAFARAELTAEDTGKPVALATATMRFHSACGGA